nr:dentin sialophosphoprotein-like [Osmia lignaria]
MPRSTRDSEENVDPKPGRKTRLTDELAVDSSLRRSSRIKTVKQNESSPESFSSNSSNVNNTQTRVTRNRTGTMDNITTTEKQRPLRSRMNSISSNVSEDTKNDANTMTPTKRNRNSIMGDVFNKTDNRRNTRFTRAGSESKTPPMRVTRNTRASSMEPESVEENKHMDKNECEFIHTSNKIKRRTSIVPSETTVVEEKEEIMKILVVALDRTLPNVSEVKEMGLNNSLKSAQKHESMSNAEDNFDASCNVVNEKSIKDISGTPTEVDEEVSKKEELKEEESAHDSSTLKHKSTEKSGSDEQKSESIQETCNKNPGNEAVEETPIELNEEELKEEEFASDSSTLKNKSTEKPGSDEQKSESIQETCNKNQENDAVEDNDSGITAGNLFQDIPSAEWKKKNDDTDKNSIHSMSTERLETEMETECDLVLVDREAWLAAENIKTAKEKEASDYNSDDTVLLKMQRDSVKAQKNEKMKMNKSVDKMNDSKDTSINENDIDNEATNMKDFKDETENENQEWNEHSTSKHNVSSWKSPERKNLNKSHKTMEAEENLSKSITKKRKSLNKLTSKVDVSRKSLNKSIQKEMEGESVINKSARKDKEKRSLNISSRKQRNCIEESENESKDSSISEKKSNAEKKFSRKRSAIRTIESDSDDSKSESGNSENKTIELPKFMLDEASNIDSNESDKSMDSDIEKEYNLAGKEISKFSDDDVRGDECRASETESSDPEDNGSDLDDFIVDDVEEDEESEGEGEKVNEESEDEGEKANEESEDEGEKANEEIEIEESEGEEEKVNEESEEEGEKVNEEIEIEELHTDEDTEKSQEKKIKEQDEAMQVQEPDAIDDKIKEGMTEEESQNKNERENIEEDVDKLIDTSSKQKNKLEISDRLSTTQTSRKKKLKKVDISQSEKSEDENNLSDLSLSNALKMKTTKQKKHASSEFILEDIELSFNDSQSIFNKRNQKLSKSMIKCSTPKSHYLPKSNRFDDSIKTQNTNDGKVNASLDIDKIEDTSLKTKDTFKKLGKIKSKENLVDKRFSCGLEELVEKTKFSKPLSPKIANLNKSNLVPDSDTPTTKYLKKDKLNESAPVLKLNTVFKKLVDANDNDEQNNALNQLKEESENVNTPNSETSYLVLDLDTSLKQKVLSVADNILKVDRRKKHKKRKQTAEKSNATILIEDSFFEDIESQIVNEDKNVVSTIDTDKNKKFEEVSLNEEKKKEKKKKKQKIAHIDINKDVEEEELHEEVTDTKIKIAKKPKKVKKKQEKEITEDLPDICSENQVSGKKKKKKKISEALLNEEIPTTRISKKTQKLSKDIAVQNDETAVNKLPKKKKKLVSEDASSQEKILTNKLPKKKQNVSPNDTSQDKNISAKKLLKKQKIQKEAEDTKSEVKPVKKSNKSQQSTDIVPDSDEGPTFVKFSEPLKEALKVTDSIKINKEKEKKKEKKRTQEIELENEKPKSKKQKIKDNKVESTRGIKRLSVELLENFSDVPSKPLKKRKLSKIKDQILSSPSMFNLNAKEVENVYVEEDFESLSSCGSTTQFAVVNMQKMKKKKKIRGVVSFKRKMIATDSRQPASAHLMYLKKH